MELWRLYRAAHGPGLDGAGGLQAAGRWHELGSPAVYFGASPGIVVLEKLAHLDPATFPHDLVLGRFQGDVRFEELAPDEIDEIDNLGDIGKTRVRGEVFLKSRSACLLRVPSVVLPEESNWVCNPLQAEAARIELLSARPFSFDGRLL